MARKTITLCDECGADGSVLPFVIEGDGRLARVDLCPVHGAPLLGILDVFAEVQTARSVRNGDPEIRRGEHYRNMVTTMDELDELVKRGR